MADTSTTAETWKPVVGWEGLYEVSDHGNVRSLDRIVYAGSGRTRKSKGRTIAQLPMPTGHLWVHLCRDGSKDSDRVHRLVMAACVGPCPEGMEVRHIDGDPTNNRVGNLQYGTRSENMDDRVTHGTHHQTVKTHCPQGHELIMPNLNPKQHGRSCRACSQAAARISYEKRKGYPLSDRQTLSDEKYRTIMQRPPLAA
ncbi:NUMOD4 motif-containing HNH endonuclease [Corynebacterium sp. AOP40-4SA-5]|uniref:NUMOD4 motif-containing HNH endonuclease n=1 Tax=Corynebacterium sp. AOP40-4SA-5 TaxID=3457678 RepID=UPI004034B801